MKTVCATKPNQKLKLRNLQKLQSNHHPHCFQIFHIRLLGLSGGPIKFVWVGFFSGLLFPELMSFQVPISFDGDKENCLLATPDRVSTPDCLSAKPYSSQNSCGSSPCLRRSTVPLDLSMLSAARTCSELETERTFPESWNQQTAACTRTPGDKASASFYFILPAVIKCI